MLTNEHVISQDPNMSYRKDGKGFFLQVKTDPGALHPTEYPVDLTAIHFIEGTLQQKYAGEKSVPVFHFQFQDSEVTGDAEYYPDMNLISDTGASREVVKRLLSQTFPDWENNGKDVAQQIQNGRWYDSSIAKGLTALLSQEDLDVTQETTPVILYQGLGTFKTYDTMYLVNSNAVFNTNLRRIQPDISHSLETYALLPIDQMAIRVITEPVQ